MSSNNRIKINSFEGYFCAFLLVAMTLLMTTEVIGRYVFSHSLSWSEELVRFMFIWFIFISASYAAETKSHIYIESFHNMLPKGIRPYVSLIGKLVWGAFSLFIAYIGTIYSFNISNVDAPALGISMSFIYFGIPAGYLLMSFRVFKESIIDIKNIYESINSSTKRGE